VGILERATAVFRGNPQGLNGHPNLARRHLSATTRLFSLSEAG